LAIAAAFPACSRKGRLNVFNWSDYVAASTIPGFEREAGVSVQYGQYESAEEMMARVLSGNSGWDVVFPSNAFVTPMREMGLLARLDTRRLGGRSHLDTLFQSPPWDPDLAWSLPYMWGATGIAYQRSLPTPPRRWSDLWEPRFAGRVTMLDAPSEVLGACLKRRGRPLNSSDPPHLDEARADAIALKRNLRGFLNAEARDQLVAGDLLAAQAWRLTARQAIDAAPDRLAFLYPAEGFPIYADCAAILRESRRPELAHAFLDYLLRPEVAAAIAREMKTSTCNRSAQNLLGLPDPVPDGGEWFQPLDAASQRRRDRLWTEIKSA
jgi:spermidine/putrescine-binding protein